VVQRKASNAPLAIDVKRDLSHMIFHHCCPVKSLPVSEKPNVYKASRDYVLVSI
jgi:hypothetical protein